MRASSPNDVIRLNGSPGLPAITWLPPAQIIPVKSRAMPCSSAAHFVGSTPFGRSHRLNVLPPFVERHNPLPLAHTSPPPNAQTASAPPSIDFAHVIVAPSLIVPSA